MSAAVADIAEGTVSFNTDATNEPFARLTLVSVASMRLAAVSAQPIKMAIVSSGEISLTTAAPAPLTLSPVSGDALRLTVGD
jgi:hypothetical protein